MKIAIKDKIIIVCNGEKTERNYLNQFKQKINESDIGNLDIEIIPSNNKSHPRQVLNKAKNILDDNERMRNVNEVWIVIDFDDADDFNEIIREARRVNIKVAYSNEAFELWYILHYVYLTKYIARNDYKKLIEKNMGKSYNKNDTSHFNILESRMDQAINNAKRGHQQMSRDLKNPKDACSSTTVYQLVEYLKKWI